MCACGGLLLPLLHDSGFGFEFAFGLNSCVVFSDICSSRPLCILFIHGFHFLSDPEARDYAHDVLILG